MGDILDISLYNGPITSLGIVVIYQLILSADFKKVFARI